MDMRERWREDDAAALDQRLAGLRQLSRDIADAVDAIPDPETYLDGERAARAVTTSDRMLARLPDDDDDDDDTAPPPEPPHPTRSSSRLTLRTTADRVLAAIQSIPRPTTFLDADRAARCVLASQAMLNQLYTEPTPGKARRAFADDHDDDDDYSWKYPDAAGELLRRLDRYTHLAVDVCGNGLWPDGSAFDRDIPTNDDLFLSSDIAALKRAETERVERDIPGENILYRWFTYTIAGRVNVIARAHAQRTGTWPNGKPYVSGEPDIYFVSRAFEDRAIRKLTVPDPPDETEVPGFPPWMTTKKLYTTG